MERWVSTNVFFICKCQSKKSNTRFILHSLGDVKIWQKAAMSFTKRVAPRCLNIKERGDYHPDISFYANYDLTLVERIKVKENVDLDACLLPITPRVVSFENVCFARNRDTTLRHYLSAAECFTCSMDTYQVGGDMIDATLEVIADLRALRELHVKLNLTLVTKYADWFSKISQLENMKSFSFELINSQTWINYVGNDVPQIELNLHYLEIIKILLSSPYPKKIKILADSCYFCLTVDGLQLLISVLQNMAPGFSFYMEHIKMKARDFFNIV